MRLVDTLQQGAGLYTMREAATYASMPQSTLRAWHCGTTGHRPLRQAVFSKAEGSYLTFVEFAELIAIRSLRFSYGISLPKIRDAMKIAKDHYHIEYPFANKHHKTFVLGKDLVIEIEGDGFHTQISGKHKMQQGMTPCLQSYMQDFVWNDAKVLQAYVAYRYATDVEKPIEIRMSPNIYSGAPMVGSTGHTAETLWREAKAIGDIAEAASNYCVGKDDVFAACKYCEWLGLAA
jgi:uncharacterized protein (DUF433 family)